MSEDIFDDWGEDESPWLMEMILKGMQKFIKEQKKLEEAINKIKETSFYKEYIDKLYICDEDRDRIIYSAKKLYDSESENKFLNELGEDFPYILFDICYMDYLESGKPSLTLKEI